MTDQPANGGTTPPAPPPAPAPDTAPPPVTDAAGLTADEEAELGTLVAKRDAGATLTTGGVVRMKVDGPDGSSMTFGGITITTEYSDVPAWHAAGMMTAAADAGLTIEQEES